MALLPLLLNALDSSTLDARERGGWTEKNGDGRTAVQSLNQSNKSNSAGQRPKNLIYATLLMEAREGAIKREVSRHIFDVATSTLSM